MIRVGSIVFRVEDLQRQTEFWAAALDYVPREGPSDDDFLLLRPRDGVGPNLSFDMHHSELGVPPRIHLDLYAENQTAEVEPAELTRDELHAALEANVQRAEAQVIAARNATAAAHKAELDAQRTLATAKKELAYKFPPISTTQNIKEYLHTENLKRAAAVGSQTYAIPNPNGNPADAVIPASLLDRELSSRSRGFGSGRKHAIRGTTPEQRQAIAQRMVV